MIELTGKLNAPSIDFVNSRIILTFEAENGRDARNAYDELKDYRIDVRMQRHRERRSKNANSYFWVLCGKLADKLDASRLEVYRKYIKEINVCRICDVAEDAADTLIKVWSEYGLGWVAEKLDNSNKDGFITICLYYGSSVYTTKQMSRLLNLVIDDCNEQGIQTKTPEEIAELVSLWEAEK